MLGACEPGKHETGLHPQCLLGPLLGGFICSQFPFVLTNLEEIFIVFYQMEVDPAVQSSPLALF